MKLQRGTLLQGGKYKIEQCLGQGTFGISYLASAKYTTDGNLGKMDVIAKVAIKEFFMSDINSRKEDGSTVEGSRGSIFTNYKKRFRKEAENLVKLSHTNIVRVFDVFDENNTTYYVMEYLSDTSLNKYIKDRNGLSEEECIAMTNRIGGALRYMHDALMLHLDLKPGNIMLRAGEPVLIDFGLSKQFNADGEPETCTTIGQGTPGYAPLEQQHYKRSQSKGFPFGMDVYALGGTMFKMITAQTPPEASEILNDGFPRHELSARGVSAHLISVIERAMAPGKNERYQTIAELLSALNPNPGQADLQPELTATSAKGAAESTAIKHPGISATLTGEDAALKPGTVIQSPDGMGYVVEEGFCSQFKFTYFCHYQDSPDKKAVVRELFFKNCSCRKDGIVSPLGNVDYVEIYGRKFTRMTDIPRTIPAQPNLEYFADSFKADGTWYVVSDHVDGENLRDIQERQKRNFTEKETISITKQICSGLAYLNTHGLMHLDIRPHNILKHSNRYILINFGLSKVTNAEGDSDPFPGFTPGYSSYEQECGTGNLTPACDIYSLGATMYNLLTGQTPPPASQLLQEGFQTMRDALQKNHVSLEMIQVIQKAMASKVRMRYQSPLALSNALSAITPNIKKVGADPHISKAPAARNAARPNKDTRKSDHKTEKIPATEAKTSYNRLPAAASFVIGSALIAGMLAFSSHFDTAALKDLGPLSWSILCLPVIASFIIISNLISGAKRIAKKRWNQYKVAAMILFCVNTLSLPLWYNPFAIAAAVLSTCLLVIVCVLLLMHNAPSKYSI